MRRISLFTIALLTLAGCGGGGAAIEAPQSSNPETTNPPTTPSNPGTPSSAVVTTAGTSFSPATITVTPGSVVTWRISGATHNVTFGAAKPTGGDIPDIAAGGQADRSFGTAGTYDYQCTRHSGMTGRVVVTADGSGPLPPPSTPSEGIVVQATASAFSPERVEINAGATVTWQFNEGAGGIVFDDDEAPSGGDIPPASAGTRVSRTFTAPGDYDYHSTSSRDIKGRIRVR
jgi:plastocyanin